MSKNFSVALSLLLDSAKYTRGLREASAATKAFRNGLLQAFLPVATVTTLVSSFKSLTTEIYNQTRRLNSLDSSYKVVFDNSADLSATYDRLRQMSDKYGVSILNLKEEYIKFAAASKGTSLEGKQSLDIFEALNSSMAKLGSSEETINRALVAVTQMMSKGTVSAEELRGQLGEALPGAFNLAAKAMGVSTAELGKMLKNGDVLASDMLPKLANELKKTFGTGYVDTLAAAGGRLQSTITNVVDDLGAGDFFKNIINGANAFIKVITGNTTTNDMFDPMVKSMKELVDYGKSLVLVLGAAFGVKQLSSLVAYRNETKNLNGSILKLKDDILESEEALSRLKNHQKRGVSKIIIEEEDGTFTRDVDINETINNQTNHIKNRKAELANLEKKEAAAASRVLAVKSMITGVLMNIGIGIAFAVGAWILNISGVVTAFEAWYDKLTGLKSAVKDFNQEVSKQQAKTGALFGELSLLSIESERYNQILTDLKGKYTVINKYIDQQTGKLTNLKAAQAAVNEEILRNQKIQSGEKRADEIATVYSKVESRKTDNLLGITTSPEQKGALRSLLNDVNEKLRESSITAEEATERVKNFFGNEVYKSSGIINGLTGAITKLAVIKRNVGDLATAAEQWREQTNLAAKEFGLTASNLPKEIGLANQHLQEKREADKAAAEAAKQKAEADKKEAEEIAKKNKEIEKNISLIERLTKALKPKGAYTGSKKFKTTLDDDGTFTPIEGKEPVGFEADKLQAKANAATAAANKILEDSKERFNAGVTEMINDGVEGLVESSIASLASSIGEALGSGDWDSFLNNILSTIGSFLKQIGAALIAYGVAMDAFKKAFSNPWLAIAAGTALVVLGGYLSGLASKGPSGSSSSSYSSGSSGGNYSMPAQNQENKVVFEISGNKLVGVLDNYDKRKYNFR